MTVHPCILASTGQGTFATLSYPTAASCAFLSRFAALCDLPFPTLPEHTPSAPLAGLHKARMTGLVWPLRMRLCFKQAWLSNPPGHCVLRGHTSLVSHSAHRHGRATRAKPSIVFTKFVSYCKPSSLSTIRTRILR